MTVVNYTKDGDGEIAIRNGIEYELFPLYVFYNDSI